MDILYADRMKVEMRFIIWYAKRKLKKEYGVTIDQIKNDLDHCGNPIIATIWKEINGAAEQINEKWQKETVSELPMIALWIIYKDTAYMNPFVYILKKVFDDKEKLEPFINKFYKEPKDWYVNRWHDTKEHTKEMKAEGNLPKDVQGALSPDEQIFVPKYQRQQIELIDKEIKKRKQLVDIGKKSIKDLED